MMNFSLFNNLKKALRSVKEEPSYLELPKNKIASSQSQLRDFYKNHRKVILIGVK